MRFPKTAAVAAAMLLTLGVPAAVAHADPKTTIDGDGTYNVGADIAPGNYASAGPTPNGACYWKRVSNGKVVDNALTKKSQVVSIVAGESFTTNDCQPWAQTDQSPPPQGAPGDLLGQLGMFIGSGILGGGPPAGAPPAATPSAPGAPLPAEAPR